MKSKRKKPERFLLSVTKGGFIPADGYTQSRLKAKGYKCGDVVLAQLNKPRSARFHRLAHYFGKLVSENIDEFSESDPHQVLKRIQLESGIGCEEIGIKVPGIGYTTVRIPKSLSFADMDAGEFEEVFKGLARHVAKMYWHSLTEEQISEMVEAMPND